MPDPRRRTPFSGQPVGGRTDLADLDAQAVTLVLYVGTSTRVPRDRIGRESEMGLLATSSLYQALEDAACAANDDGGEPVVRTIEVSLRQALEACRHEVFGGGPEDLGEWASFQAYGAACRLRLAELGVDALQVGDGEGGGPRWLVLEPERALVLSEVLAEEGMLDGIEPSNADDLAVGGEFRPYDPLTGAPRRAGDLDRVLAVSDACSRTPEFSELRASLRKELEKEGLGEVLFVLHPVFDPKDKAKDLAGLPVEGGAGMEGGEGPARPGAWLSEICVPEGEEGKGLGTRAMEIFVRCADSAGVDVGLLAFAYRAEGGTSETSEATKRLAAWYGGFGFEPQSQGGLVPIGGGEEGAPMFRAAALREEVSDPSEISKAELRSVSGAYVFDSKRDGSFPFTTDAEGAALDVWAAVLSGQAVEISVQGDDLSDLCAWIRDCAGHVATSSPSDESVGSAAWLAEGPEALFDAMKETADWALSARAAGRIPLDALLSPVPPQDEGLLDAAAEAAKSLSPGIMEFPEMAVLVGAGCRPAEPTRSRSV